MREQIEESEERRVARKNTVEAVELKLEHSRGGLLSLPRIIPTLLHEVDLASFSLSFFPTEKPRIFG
jgi:hypothetical protein